MLFINNNDKSEAFNFQSNRHVRHVTAHQSLITHQSSTTVRSVTGVTELPAHGHRAHREDPLITGNNGGARCIRSPYAASLLLLAIDEFVWPDMGDNGKMIFSCL